MIDIQLLDDADINTELKYLFARTNILTRRFARCSNQVILRLFRTYCMCFMTYIYDRQTITLTAFANFPLYVS